VSDGWTVQVLPDDGGDSRTVRVSRRALRWGGAVAGGLLVLLLALGAWAGVGAWRGSAVSELRSENRSLRAQLRSADRTVNRLAGRLDRMATQERRFRLLAGLPLLDEELRQVGVGGPGAGSAEAGASLPLDRLLRRADLVHASLSEAADSMAARREHFLSRPSIRPVADEISWISSGYSRSRYHPVLDVSRPHEGVDVSAPRGAPIRATANGRVVEVDRRSGFGRVVEIDHGHGFRTLYAHAAEIAVRPGQRVERGETIGRVGESGLTSGPNVHYEVRVDGRPVDPRRFFVENRVPQ
jgi:murein DD-endopeptidase MepM/ murein hydrolase activator NlpD